MNKKKKVVRSLEFTTWEADSVSGLQSSDTYGCTAYPLPRTCAMCGSECRFGFAKRDDIVRLLFFSCADCTI